MIPLFQAPSDRQRGRTGLVVYALAAYVPLQHVTRDFCMKAAFLPDRGVVKVSGEGARDFLNGLLTTDVAPLRPGLGRFGALLTPQGKIIVDFLITEAPAGHGGGFLFDCPRALAQALADKLGFYKLRAKVAVENLSDSFGVLAAWDGDLAIKPDLCFADPRNAALGWRILVPEELAQKVTDLIGAKTVGTVGSPADRNGLALIRIDRAADALAAGLPLTSGGLAVRVADPDELLTSPKQTVR